MPYTKVKAANKIPDEIVQRALDLHQKHGLNASQISRTLKVSRTAVDAWLRKAGLKTSSRGRPRGDQPPVVTVVTHDEIWFEYVTTEPGSPRALELSGLLLKTQPSIAFSIDDDGEPNEQV